jgi:hypothetical protein
VTRRFLEVAILLIFVCGPAFSQENPVAVLGPAEKAAVIEAVCQNLEREYIFPDITERYIQTLKENLRSGIYGEIDDPQEFAGAITGDLARIHEDRHLRVQFDPEWVAEERNRKELDQEAIERKEWRDRAANYGFGKIEILPGNIGYLELNSFSYQPDAYDVAAGAMSFLANTDALIVDLRSNGGGSPEMVQFLCSYFFEIPRKHLNSFTYRDPGKLTQYWTYTYLPGRRLGDVELFVLTSENTFSAAEEFAYNLKSMQRAVIVGETTGGGGHDNRFVVLTDRFMMSLPFARAVNPVTQDNWEEVGVEPDVAVARDTALKTALALASASLAGKEGQPYVQAFHTWYHDIHESDLHPTNLDESALQAYVGTYGPRTITLEDGSLFYQRQGRDKMKMIPMGRHLFRFDEPDWFRLRFLREDDIVVAVEGLTPDGRNDIHSRD